MAESENLQGTNLSQGKGSMGDTDVEALIKETLAATQAERKEPPKAATEIKEEKSFKGTPLSPTPKKEAPQPQATAPKPETKAPKAKPEEPKDSYAATFKEYKSGDIVPGTVVKVDNNSLLVDIGYKAEGILAIKDLSSKDQKAGLKVGDKINVLIEKLENREGYVELSKEKADYEVSWNQAYQAYKERSVLDAKVTSAVKGGLVVDYSGIRGFIPASQVKKAQNAKLEDFVGTVIPIKVIQIDRRAGKVVLSHKLAAGEKKNHEKEKILNEIEVGQVKHGTVSSVKNFGAFVDLGGIEGLIHITELSWKRVKHPSVVVKVGQELDVFVLGVDKVNKKVALGLKELQPDPWEAATSHYKPGQIVKGKIARLTNFGAFIELGHDLEGLCHISEISNEKIAHPQDVVKPGDEVDVKILRVLPDEQKIGLSIKRVIQDREKAKLKETQAKKEEETKVTIGDMMKQKEVEKAERKAEKEEKTEESMSVQTDIEIAPAENKTEG
ncbi:MAG: 30S ribosomal protein S1 [Candidatus Margulisbacteria bacterium]|nr:30S ribosomal protein S1 [Candidatus Margulisiibacteriota bacterium]MBU1021713.1 30S ribosomal protein S1 [Candidatus Margulisiibacteriota bacterium]MBU1729459.1 30S ribosomal protein S1 [Candidatus Margulisiibacteriota bacterium]MBU1955440.1 30S ribosomal protein S1 [Candidatus Margulisiibacteriota bacterium]